MEQLIFRDRRGSNSTKWNFLTDRFTRDDLMGLWVADMDFVAADCIRKALTDRIEYGVFGYDKVPESYYQAFINWEKKYHNYNVERSWIRYAPGVVSAFTWFIELFTHKGDAVMVQSPVYYPFMASVRNADRPLVTSELV